jgi:hypothetical protein
MSFRHGFFTDQLVRDIRPYVYSLVSLDLSRNNLTAAFIDYIQ